MAQTNYTPLTPTGYQAISATSSTAVSLTVPTPAAGQTASTYVFLVAETGNFRYRDDGTAPTAAVGTLILAGQALEYDGKLSAIQVISTAGSAAVSANYYRVA